MAYWVQERGAHGRSYICDFASDVAKLPTNLKRGAAQGRDDDEETGQMTAEGSDAIVLENGSVYMLNSQGEWKKL